VRWIRDLFLILKDAKRRLTDSLPLITNTAYTAQHPDETTRVYLADTSGTNNDN